MEWRNDNCVSLGAEKRVYTRVGVGGEGGGGGGVGGGGDGEDD